MSEGPRYQELDDSELDERASARETVVDDLEVDIEAAEAVTGGTLTTERPT